MLFMLEEGDSHVSCAIQKQHEIRMKFDGIAIQMQAMLNRAKEELHDAFHEDLLAQVLARS